MLRTGGPVTHRLIVIVSWFFFFWKRTRVQLFTTIGRICDAKLSQIFSQKVLRTVTPVRLEEAEGL